MAKLRLKVKQKKLFKIKKGEALASPCTKC